MCGLFSGVWLTICPKGCPTCGSAPGLYPRAGRGKIWQISQILSPQQPAAGRRRKEWSSPAISRVLPCFPLAMLLKRKQIGFDTYDTIDDSALCQPQNQSSRGSGRNARSNGPAWRAMRRKRHLGKIPANQGDLDPKVDHQPVGNCWKKAC